MTELQWLPTLPQIVKCNNAYAFAYILTCNISGVLCTKTLLRAYYLHFIHYSLYGLYILLKIFMCMEISMMVNNVEKLSFYPTFLSHCKPVVNKQSMHLRNMNCITHTQIHCTCILSKQAYLHTCTYARMLVCIYTCTHIHTKHT